MAEVFFTPGWGVIIGVGGTLSGVVLTQAANSLIGWRTSRRERHHRMTEAVSELIASGNSWMYAVSTQEQDLLLAVGTNVPHDELMVTLKEARAVLYAAQLDFGRALARVRLTCPPKVVRAAEDYRIAVHAFEQESRDKGQHALKYQNVIGIEATDPDHVTFLLSNLVDHTRGATGYRKRPKDIR
jgi:hypothetical protein